MQDIGNAFEIKRPVTLNNLVYIQTARSKPHGNCKPRIYNIYTHTNEKGIQIQHSSQSSNPKRREQKRKGRKKTTKTNPKQLTKWQ